MMLENIITTISIFFIIIVATKGYETMESFSRTNQVESFKMQSKALSGK